MYVDSRLTLQPAFSGVQGKEDRHRRHTPLKDTIRCYETSIHSSNKTTTVVVFLKRQSINHASHSRVPLTIAPATA